MYTCIYVINIAKELCCNANITKKKKKKIKDRKKK